MTHGEPLPAPLAAGLTLGTTLRLTRLIVADDLGAWWLRWPVDNAKHRWMQRHGTSVEPGWARYADGLTCPFCVGYWVGAAVLASYAVAGHTRAWRFLAATLTLNEVAGHLAARLGDTATE
jgi:hypothetical protein